VSGPAELHESVLSTVASWRFQPAHRGGTPVRYRKSQAIVFRLEAT
jgi:outer membrane biosynthesis protein TonB